VGSDVLRVKADDADVSPENNRIDYSIIVSHELFPHILYNINTAQNY